MSITSLGIEHFRNLSAVQIQPAPGLNLIIGPNGSGKTSVLEAIYYLSRARSFRTHRFDRVVQEQQQQLQLTCRLKVDDHTVPLGLRRSRSGLEIRLAGESVRQVSQLVSSLPVQVIHPASHRLLEEGPQFRRRYLDWGVFHVEHHFYPAWKRYQRALQQRNRALREHHDEDMVRSWHQELSEAGETIHQARLRYVNRLNEYLPRFLAPILLEQELTLRYEPGWDTQYDLERVLDMAVEKDMQQTQTRQGPHRADLAILLNKRLAKDRVSRGQQKLLVTGLLLAQAALLYQDKGRAPVLLVDDLAAELDGGHRRFLFERIRESGMQAFVTAIDARELQHEAEAVFHVEHGNVRHIESL